MDFQDMKTGPLSQMSGAEVLAQLTENAGENPLMSNVLQEMLGKLSEARQQYFRKPVATMPMGATPEHASELARLHPELRELMFEPNEARPDAVFQGCRHLAVRRCFLQLLSTDSDAVDNPYAYRLLTSGISTIEHNFVWRTQVPIIDLDRQTLDRSTRSFGVVDLTRSRYSIADLLEMLAGAEMAELLVVAPYDQRMWRQFGGQQLSGGYTFEWIQSGRSLQPDLVKPINLPTGFFKSRAYANWKLYVQPHGSADAIVYTRAEFLALFSGVTKQHTYHEIRVTRNGFAELSYIYTPDRITKISVPSVIEQEMVRAIPLGHVEVPKLTGTLGSELSLGRQYDLITDEPVYVRANYMQKALQQYYTVKAGRMAIPAMMRSLHANSARLVYNGAIVTAESMVDSEVMVTVLERIMATNTEAKAKLTTLSAVARLPSDARPTDYATALLSWASLKAINSTDVAQGVKSVVDYLTSLSQGTINTGGQQLGPDDFDLQGLVYGSPDKTIDEDKEELVEVIRDYAEDTFISTDLPYTLEREAVQVDKSDTFALRMELRRMKQQPVSIEEVQSVYDSVFPGNSMIDPTMVQVAAESGDVKFIIDVQYFKASIPSMFSTLEGYTVVPSKLRTSIGADLMSSFRSLMSSLMKRNFNRPRPEAPGDRQKFVHQSVSESIRRHGKKAAGALMARYAMDAITVSDETVRMWAQRHPVSDVLAAATMLEDMEVDPSAYRLMPKDVPKPTMSMTAQGQVAAGQTIVFHSKDLISLTCGVFTVLVTRLLALFDDNIRFAFGADEATSGQWADKYLECGGYVYEIDIPKFDKTQDWTCFELILHVMELCGCDPDLVTFWRKASEGATVFNSLFHLVFHTMYGNRSGSSATLAVNCIVLLFSFLSSFADLGIIAILIKGDDSVVITKRQMTLKHQEYLYEWWGFSMKLVQKPGSTGFCSSFFVKDKDGHYQLIRDPMRVLEKFGRALPVNKPASYFLDYYVSVVDTAVSYSDPVLVANLQVAVSTYYGTPIDVETIVRFVRYVSSSSRTFLKVLYGFSDEQIEGLNNIDDAVETMTRIRSTRFVKGKQLIDMHSSLKLPIVDKVKICSDWLFTD